MEIKSAAGKESVKDLRYEMAALIEMRVDLLYNDPSCFLAAM